MVVIGGGLVGCEAALYLSEKADNVTIVEALDDILQTGEECKNNELSLRDHLKAAGVSIVTGTKVTGISETAVSVESKTGSQDIHADTVLIAVGYSPLDQLADALADKVDLTVVGDAEQPRKIINAVHEAYHAIRVLA